jgi:hypothetical protein
MLTAVLASNGQNTPKDSSARARDGSNRGLDSSNRGLATDTHLPDTSYKKRRISSTQIQVLYSYYTQDGDHSAITGGTGTEWLHVYSPEFTITHRPDSNRTFGLNAGIDIITSASMDNIDFVKSSASRVSDRLYVNPSYSFLLKRSRTQLGINTGMSIESAYLSFPAGVSVNHNTRSGATEISASLQCYFDDLRFGRLSKTYSGPLELVYPVELRDTSWFSFYRRKSYNLDLALYQVINTKMQLAIFPELVYQKGLLSTPYHRVYFNDGHTERVENLPTKRWKFPLGIQFNFFAAPRIIIRSYYRFYHDNFGITAHTIQIEVAVKITPQFTLSPLARFYTQTPAFWFHPSGRADTRERYYTSDYDLSRFTSYKPGLTIRYAPQNALGRHYTFDAVSLRYCFYKRSDGLTANILSLLLDMGHTRQHD